MQYREKVDLEIERMLAYGTIERSTTPFINPMLPVNKSNGSVRLCMDARELNKRLQPDRDGPEEMEEVLRKCIGSKVMSNIGLTASFWQVPLNENSKKYCGFKHGGKTYHHDVLPFGTCVSSAGLTRAAEKPLKGLDFVIDFVDDWLIISSNMSQHLENLENLSTRILLEGITVNFKKLKLRRSEMKFLGHIITTKGIKIDSEKVEIIEQFERPSTPKEVRSFLGLINFSLKFTNRIAFLTGPLKWRSTPGLSGDGVRKNKERLRR